MRTLHMLGVATAVALGSLARADETKKPADGAPKAQQPQPQPQPQPQQAQQPQPQPQPQPQQSPENREAVEKVDKLIKNFTQYRERVAEKSENARKDVEAMIKDLSELTEQRYNMALLAMTLRASQAAGGSNDLAAREAMTRDLRQIQVQLRAEIEQAQGQVNQAAVQLEAMRRQLTQPKSEEAHNARGNKDHKSGATHDGIARGGDPG